ncbi:hypothetical protein EDB85DRAFT_1955905, partial [Lactarius pseudohatsudake]
FLSPSLCLVPHLYSLLHTTGLCDSHAARTSSTWMCERTHPQHLYTYGSSKLDLSQKTTSCIMIRDDLNDPDLEADILCQPEPRRGACFEARLPGLSPARANDW